MYVLVATSFPFVTMGTGGCFVAAIPAPFAFFFCIATGLPFVRGMILFQCFVRLDKGMYGFFCSIMNVLFQIISKTNVGDETNA
jgi:hypothetical protein